MASSGSELDQETGFIATIIHSNNNPFVIDSTGSARVFNTERREYPYHLLPLLHDISPENNIYIGEILLLEETVIPDYKIRLQDPDLSILEKSKLKDEIRMLMSMESYPAYTHLENLLLFNDFFDDSFLLDITERLKRHFFINNGYIIISAHFFPTLLDVSLDVEDLNSKLQDKFDKWHYREVLLIDNNEIIELFDNEFNTKDIEFITQNIIPELLYPDEKTLIMKSDFFYLISDEYSLRKLLALVVLQTRIQQQPLSYLSDFGNNNIYNDMVQYLRDNFRAANGIRLALRELIDFQAEAELIKKVERDMQKEDKTVLKEGLEQNGIDQARNIDDVDIENLLQNRGNFTNIIIRDKEINNLINAFFAFKRSSQDAGFMQTSYDILDYLLKIMDGTIMRNIYETNYDNDNEYTAHLGRKGLTSDPKKIISRTKKYLNIDDKTITSLEILKILMQNELTIIPGASPSGASPSGSLVSGAPASGGLGPDIGWSSVPGLSDELRSALESDSEPEPEPGVMPLQPMRRSASNASPSNVAFPSASPDSSGAAGIPGASASLRNFFARRKKEREHEADDFEREIEAQKEAQAKRRSQRGGARPKEPVIVELPVSYIFNQLTDEQNNTMMDNEKVCKIIQEVYEEDELDKKTFIKPTFNESAKDVNELMSYFNEIGPKIIEESEMDYRRKLQIGGKKTRNKTNKDKSDKMKNKKLRSRKNRKNRRSKTE